MDEQLLTIADVAGYLRVSAKTVYRLIRRRAIPCYRVANQWRFDRTHIEEWMRRENYRPVENRHAGNQ